MFTKCVVEKLTRCVQKFTKCATRFNSKSKGILAIMVLSVYNCPLRPSFISTPPFIYPSSVPSSSLLRPPSSLLRPSSVPPPSLLLSSSVPTPRPYSSPPPSLLRSSFVSPLSSARPLKGSRFIIILLVISVVFY